jgi:hypothetical protein
MRAIRADVSADLRRLLRKLGEMGHCSPAVPSRFSDQRDKKFVAWGAGGPFDLVDLPHLSGAQLTLHLRTDRDHTRLYAFTAAVEGFTVEGATWIAAVDLDDDLKGDQMGSGACGHASFHCHVGPTRTHRPQTRVPFPAVGPVAAVDWLLSQVVPGWEPAPWNTISPTNKGAG